MIRDHWSMIFEMMFFQNRKNAHRLTAVRSMSEDSNLLWYRGFGMGGYFRRVIFPSFCWNSFPLSSGISRELVRVVLTFSPTFSFWSSVRVAPHDISAVITTTVGAIACCCCCSLQPAKARSDSRYEIDFMILDLSFCFTFEEFVVKRIL